MGVSVAQKVQDHFSEFGGEYANHFLAAVPEPTSIGLLAVAGGLLGARRRRRSR
jgi:hypothetical protein